MDQLIITMRHDFARQYSGNRSLLNMKELLEEFKTAALIGSEGYSMRIVLDESETPALKAKLKGKFIVETDHAMTFNDRPGRRPMVSAKTEPETPAMR